MHCNLRPPKTRQRFPALMTPCQVSSRSTYPPPYIIAFLPLIHVHYFTLRPWPLTFDLEHLQRMGRDEIMYQIWTESSNPQRSYCDFNIWPNDLERSVTCFTGFWDNFHHVWPSTTYQCLTYNVFSCWYVMSQCVLDLDWLTLKVCGTSNVTWSKSVRNLSEIEQSSAELLIIFLILAHVMSRRELAPFDPLIWNFYSTSGVMCFNSAQNLSEIE